MKRKVYAIAAAILFFAAVSRVSAQSGATRAVAGFNTIASSGPFDVHVNINGSESLKISASPEIVSEIETPVEDGTLKIRFKRHYNWNHDHTGRIDIYVTAKSLSSLVNSGSGTINVRGIVKGNDVRMVLSGSGDISSGVSAEKLETVISGSGTVQLEGRAGKTTIVISGSGEMKSRSLKTGSASVTISGSGNAYFSADRSVSAHIVGSGNVVYSGNASITDSHTVGSGRVTHED